jgi:MoxR-like ATPase
MTTAKPRVEVRDVPQLADLIKQVSSGLVTFDGCDGAGKTYLARQIGQALDLPPIDLDTYLEKDQGEFVGALRMDELKRDIEEALGRSPVVLVSGICMRRVLEEIDRRAALTVYVQRNTSAGLIADSVFIDAEAGEYVDESYRDHCFSGLDPEIYDYHREYRPWMNADIVFVRVAD